MLGPYDGEDNRIIITLLMSSVDEFVSMYLHIILTQKVQTQIAAYLH